jgi:hypothetical protein
VTRLDPRDRARRLVLFGDAQVAAQVEEVVLDPPQHVTEPGLESRRDRRPDVAVELVHGAVRLDAEGVLRDALPRAERRGAVVAGARVDLRDPRHVLLRSRDSEIQA